MTKKTDLELLKDIILLDPMTNKKSRIIAVSSIGEMVSIYTASPQQIKEGVATCHNIRSGECSLSDVPEMKDSTAP